MSAFTVAVAFLLAGGQPPAAPPAATTGSPVAEAPAKEPKMICKYEQAVGSRLQKTKVCRPEGQSGEEQDTKLQRELSKNGDFIDPQRGFGN